MTHSEAFLAAKYGGGFHTNMAAFTNDYLLKHGNFFMKPTLLPDGFVYPAVSEAARYRTLFRDVKCEPIDFAAAVKQEKPPTPPASPGKSPGDTTRDSSPTMLKPQQPATWIPGVQKLSWDDSTVASYNPDTKMFRCVVCNAVGFLSRIAEHYLGTHTSAKVFQCLHCPYSSTWSRCVRMHMAKHHGVPNAPPSLWKGQPLLEEIFHLLTSLKTSVDSQGRERMDPSEINDKKFVCPKCPYTTDRRDLYLRHENIHKEDKPYHCYVCFKLFNRADHVKKHFLRIHRGHPYDISLVRRRPPRVTSNKSNNFSVDKLIASDKPPKVEVVEEEEETEDAMDLSCKDDSSLEKQQLKTTYLKDDSSSERQQLKSYLKDDSSPEKQLKTYHLKDDSSSEKHKQPKTDLKEDSEKQHLRTFQCPSCEWEGVDSWCLRRHMNVHVKGFECPICEFKTGKAERLFTHVYRAHRKLVCTKCKFMTEMAQDFELHIKECCVEIVVGNAFDKISEDTSSDEASDLKFDSLNTQFIGNGQMFESPHNRLTDLKGSVSLIPLHNSISYCYPANAPGFAPTEDFGKMNLGLNGKVNISAVNGLNGSVNGINGKMLNGLVNGDAKTSSSGVKQCRMEVKAELASPVQSSSDSGVTDLTADDDADITCFHCGCEFADLASLDTHTELHHSPLASSTKSAANKTAGAKRHKFSCAVCNYRSDTQRRILEHMRYHTGEVLQCGACAFTAVCDSTLEGHVRERHSDGEKRCPHCGFLAAQRVPFIRHYRKCHHSKSCSRCRVIKRSLDPKLEEKDGLSILLENSKNHKSSEEVRPYLHHNPYSRRSNAITPYSHCNAAMSRVAVAIPPLLQRTATDTAESLQESTTDELIDKSEREKKSRKQTMPRKLLHHAKSSKMPPRKKIRTADGFLQQDANGVHQDSRHGFQQERDVVHQDSGFNEDRNGRDAFHQDRNARNAYRSSRIANRQGRKKAVRDRQTSQGKLVRGRNAGTICDTSKRRPHIRKKLLKFSKVPSSSCNRRCVMGHCSPLVFRNGVNYVRHLFWCHHARRYGCHLCSERFSHEYQVLLHRRSVHEN